MSHWIDAVVESCGWTWEVGMPERYDPHGNEYQTLLMSGVVNEDLPAVQRNRIWASNSRFAKEMYVRALVEYMGADKHHIVWRIQPDVDGDEIKGLGDGKVWHVYSRLTAYSREEKSK